MSEALFINEVGPRDGLQNQSAPISTSGKLELVRALVDAGLKAIEATAFVSPKAVPQMADAAQLSALLPRDPDLRFSALVPNRRGLERAAEAGFREVAVVLAATETMNRKNINQGLAEAQASCAEALAACQAGGWRGKAYLAVAFGCPYEGAVDSGEVMRLGAAMLGAGASELVFADTIGAASPAAVEALLGEAVRRFGAARVAVHLHDTRGLALANAWAAIRAGVRRFDSSVGGLGGCPFAPGAAGNLATEDLVLLAEQSGYSTGIDLAALYGAVAVAERLVGRGLGGRSAQWWRGQAVRPQARAVA